ncbi:MAG TPA: transcription antitermination factor NusB [bacterium]|nr:transcription antitermination factor NusB [bacterium]
MLIGQRAQNPKITAASLTRKVLERSLFINELLNNTLDAFSLPERRFITELTYGTIRNLARLDFWIEQASGKPVSRIDRDVLSHLRIALYQILFMHNREDASIVNEAVEIVKGSSRREAAGFTNFTLREILRIGPSRAAMFRRLGHDRDRFYRVWHSFPDWLAALIGDLVGEKYRYKYLGFANTPLGITLRVEGDEARRAAVIAELQVLGVTAEPAALSPHGIYTDRAVTWSMIRDWPDVHIQDESSQLAVIDMAVEPGQQVLDLCAAPGGKTIFLSWLLGPTGRVTAADVNPYKLKNIAEALLRAGRNNVDIRLQDGAAHRPEWNDAFDAVLLDAPCSALGTMRRHPEVKWLKKPTDGVQGARLAATILENAARYVKPGGTLLFSVCTFTREETTGQIQQFVQKHPEFKVEKAYYTISTLLDNRDVFFIARLRRTR